MNLVESVKKIKFLKLRLRSINEMFVQQSFSFKQNQLIERKQIKREIKLINKEIHSVILTNEITVNDTVVLNNK